MTTALKKGPASYLCEVHTTTAVLGDGKQADIPGLDV